MSNTTSNTDIMPDNVEFSKELTLERKKVKNYTAIQYTDGGGKPLSADNLNRSEIALQLFFGIGNKDPANTDIKPGGTIMELFDKINSIITSYNSNFEKTKQLSENILADMNKKLENLDYNESSDTHQFVKQVHQTDGKIDVEYQQPEQGDINGLVPRLKAIECPEYTSLNTLAELKSGEPLSDLLGKLQKAVKNYIDHQSNFGNPHKVTKDQVKLGNVPNVKTNDQKPTFDTADKLEKLNSGETLSILLSKVSKAVEELINHRDNTSNPHEVTKAQVGLGNVDNKSVEEIKTEFTGSVAENNEGFVTGDAVYDALQDYYKLGNDGQIELPDNVITTDNISENLPEDVLTSTNIDNYISENVVKYDDDFIICCGDASINEQIEQ